ncbi:MAG: ParB/RepB/Spo0J family partition protein [Gammaproteobacteria bacterium]|nr:ParB/RepB/Spo0J family partition protein [Gammaproteobacteria bacterium]
MTTLGNKKRGLGRGLDALLSSVAPAAPTVPGQQHVTDGELRELPVDLIQRGRYQPRMEIHPESLEELANSIRAQGIVQPIVVRPLDDTGRYEIIAGERRWRAAQIAGLHTIPAIVRNVPDEAAMAMALIENIQREELNPIEEATALSRLVEEFSMTHNQVADAVGRSRVAVTNLLRLLSLTDDVKRMVTNGDLEMGHARALLALSGNAQLQAARAVVAKGLSVRETERFVRRLHTQKDDDKKPEAGSDPDIRRLQTQVSERLGAKVRIVHAANGKGRLEIGYNSLEELDGILAHIK